jgi:hypothetical protein
LDNESRFIEMGRLMAYVAEKCIPVTDEDLEDEPAPYERKMFNRVSTNRITVFMLLTVQSG